VIVRLYAHHRLSRQIQTGVPDQRRLSGSLGSASFILVIGDRLEPIDRGAVQPFLDRDMAHRGGGGGTVPMFLAGGEADDIARADHLD
jgi:hypothetical protein